jgi:hypothetical protein
MNIYVEPVSSTLTETQLYIVNESDKIFETLGSEYHLGELLITNYEAEDSIPDAVMDTYNHYVERELSTYVSLNDGVNLYDKVRILSVVTKILFGTIYTEVEMPDGITEEEFMWEMLSQVTDQNSIYWEDKVVILPDLYEMFYNGLIQEVDEDDVPEVDEDVKTKIKEYLATVKNPETLHMYSIITTSTTLPIDFNACLSKLVQAHLDDGDDINLVNEIELLELATNAYNDVGDWKERVTNAFGYFPDKNGKISEGF